MTMPTRLEAGMETFHHLSKNLPSHLTSDFQPQLKNAQALLILTVNQGKRHDPTLKIVRN